VGNAQASRETADSMKTPHGAVQYMRARHCHARDDIQISVRDTHYLYVDGSPTSMHNAPMHTWHRSLGFSTSASDFEWGCSIEPMDKLTLELTWVGVRARDVPRPDVQDISAGRR
jgi:hypothetical protein